MIEPVVQKMTSVNSTLELLSSIKNEVSPLMIRIVGKLVDNDIRNTLSVMFADAVRAEIGPHLVPYAFNHDLRFLDQNRPLLSILIMFSPLVTISQILSALRILRHGVSETLGSPILYVTISDIDGELRMLEINKELKSPAPSDLEGFSSTIKH